MQTISEKEQNGMLVSMLLAFFINGFMVQPLGTLIPILKSVYGFSYNVSGILLSLQCIGGLISAVLSGILPLYVGRRTCVRILSVWMIAAYTIFLFCGGSTILLCIAFFVTGISKSGNANFANTVSSTFPKNKVSRIYNIQHSCFALGSVAGPAALAVLSDIYPDTGWRILSVIVIGLCVIQQLIYLNMPLCEIKEEKGSGIKNADMSFLKKKRFFIAAMIMLLYGALEYGIVGWIVTYFQDSGALSVRLSRYMGSFLWLFILAGRLTGAAVVGKRLPREKILIIDGVGILFFFALMYLSKSPAVILLGLAGLGFFMATVFTSGFAFGSDSIKGNDIGCSTLNLFGYVGGIISPSIIGFISENAGVTAGMLFVGVLAVILLAVAITAYRLKDIV